ncbi:hypothetical protein K1W54_29810 [Micromonospora sp. CPCC 205371]|nr:hypothetical protein [Micromonospora sp. CPCC 205371]
MTDLTPITRDDLSVEHGDAEYGPTAKVTVNAGPLAGRTFILRSTEKMTNIGGSQLSLRKGGGIHVDAGDPDAKFVDWRGAFRTFDMDKAIDYLVEEVNELAVRAALQDSLWGVLHAVTDGLSGFEESLQESSRRDWREEFAGLGRAFVALRLKVAEFDGREG